MWLTPSQYNVEFDTVSFCKKCSVNQHMKIQAFDKNPDLADGNTVHEDGKQHFALPMLKNK